MSKGERSRKDRIDDLLAAEVNGMKAGIFGREWCEACGREGSFKGFAGAMAAHTAAGRFVCADCRKGRLGNGRGGANADLLDGLILGRGFRYCGGCGGGVDLDLKTVDEVRQHPFTCDGCQGVDLGRAARRRYLEHEAKKEGGLERAEARVQWARAGIERILENPNPEEE